MNFQHQFGQISGKYRVEGSDGPLLNLARNFDNQLLFGNTSLYFGETTQVGENITRGSNLPDFLRGQSAQI